jgi:hypothetical protein
MEATSTRSLPATALSHSRRRQHQRPHLRRLGHVDGLGDFIAVIGSGTRAEIPIAAPLAAAAALDSDGLACNADSLPAASLANRVVLIMRGTCTSETSF